jgi:ribonuclease-3
MRPRFRTEPGPNASREGRPLELVRVRGTQRDPGREGRDVTRRRSRRRGGRGRGPRPPAAPASTGFSLWRWLHGLFSPERGTARAARPTRAAGALGDQETRAITEFSERYGITFRQLALLKLALTHRSYLHVTGQGPRESNERLEFLGDSVLGLVTSEFLYRAHPNEHEGQLTKTKSLLVSKAILSRRALAMGLGRFVLMSHSEVESGGRQRLSILADVFEAVVGAIYLDQGFEAARAFIERWLLRDTSVIMADKRHTNYKSHLQEYVQSTYRTHPVYRIRSEMGPDHSKQFMVEVIVGRRTLGEGKGRNKKEAEQAAARDALERVEGGPLSDREMRRAGRASSPAAVPVRTPAVARAPAAAAAPPAARSNVQAAGRSVQELTDDSESLRRRRRGRRGGRGRRSEPGEEGVLPAPAAPRASQPPRPAAPSRPVAEQEPRPKAREEDEDEEVGRPEGPREEAHVDPYAWGAAESVAPGVPSGGDSSVRSGAPNGSDREPGRASHEDAHPPPVVRGETGRSVVEPDEEEVPEPFPPALGPTANREPEEGGESSAYGRRPGRGRRTPFTR